MQRILTIELLETRTSRGYRYCLSRTTNILGDDADLWITLLPVKRAPLLKKLPERFNTYFKIHEELRQMAMGIDETTVLVDLGEINIYAGVS